MITSLVTTAASTLTDEQKQQIIKMLDYRIYRGQIGKLVDEGLVGGWVWFAAVVLFALIGYLMGSLNFAVIISKLRYKEDIRSFGSGNAGATNMSRTYGKAAGVLTLLGDILKTVIPVFAAKLLLGEVYGYMTGLFCALGHAFPCYYKFKGGKCVAVTAAIALILEPIMFVILLVIFASTVIFTKYVSLASIFSALIYPVLLHNIVTIKYGFGHAGIIFVIINCLLVVYLHRSNIKRLLDGKENKFVFKKSQKEQKPAEK